VHRRLSSRCRELPCAARAPPSHGCSKTTLRSSGLRCSGPASKLPGDRQTLCCSKGVILSCNDAGKSLVILCDIFKPTSTGKQCIDPNYKKDAAVFQLMARRFDCMPKYIRFICPDESILTRAPSWCRTFEDWLMTSNFRSIRYRCPKNEVFPRIKTRFWKIAK
jgi:hypothetical protein